MFTPEWSPDGEFIAFDANVCGEENFDVFLIDLTDPQKPKQMNLTGPPDGLLPAIRGLLSSLQDYQAPTVTDSVVAELPEPVQP